MSKHGYVLTINSKYIESEHPNKDEMKEWHNAICKLAELNTEILNKRTKNEEEALPFYRYIAVGPMECGKKEGRYHCHAYVYCTKQKTIKGQLKHWPSGTHFDAAKGNVKQIISYITKGTHSKEFVRSHPEECLPLAYEYGDRPAQGNRTDLQNALDTYQNVEEFMTEEPELYCKYRNGIRDIYALKEEQKPKYHEPVTVIWNYGETGTGKTREAFEDPECVNVDYNNGFFTNWKNAKTISLEEMNGSIPYKTLLKITDSYHNYYKVNIKGGDKLVDLKKIYISSSEHPARIYRRQNEKDGSIKQLLRRCTKIIHHTSKGKVDVTNDELNTYDDIFE